MKKVVILGDGRAVPLGIYVKAWKQCKALPAETWLSRTPDGWPGYAGDALRQFREGMDSRINRHLPWWGVGRKWDNDWQREAIQAAVRLNTPRLVVDWLPLWLRPRFEHRCR